MCDDYKYNLNFILINYSDNNSYIYLFDVLNKQLKMSERFSTSRKDTIRLKLEKEVQDRNLRLTNLEILSKFIYIYIPTYTPR